MPFRWKTKSRRNRFSQFVADHLQSPTRGGSLVVETGFPTSIIDLYVRNRDRFRKSSANKTTSSGSFLGLNNSNCIQTDEIIEEDVVVVSSEMVKLNPVIVVVLKVLFVLVLVFGTKRFTIAIMLLAFVLLFVEFACRSKKKTNLVVYNQVLEIEEQIRSEVVMEIRSKSSRKDVMKSRMKKLLRKKLRRSFVDLMDAEPLVLSNVCLDPKGEILDQNEDEIVETECVDLEKNFGCLVLLMVVLGGLIRGRVVALVMALSWCLIMNMLHWRNVKFSIS